MERDDRVVSPLRVVLVGGRGRGPRFASVLHRTNVLYIQVSDSTFLVPTIFDDFWREVGSNGSIWLVPYERTNAAVVGVRPKPTQPNQK